VVDDAGAVAVGEDGVVFALELVEVLVDDVGRGLLEGVGEVGGGGDERAAAVGAVAVGDGTRIRALGARVRAFLSGRYVAPASRG
jgi:hypothetical protein